MNHECDDLAANLANELDEPAAARFAAHLEKCADCRDAVDQQRWIDELLSSAAGTQLESPPPALVESFRTSLARRRRQRTLLAYGLAAAAVLVVAVGWTAMLNRQANLPTTLQVENVAHNQTDDAVSPEPPRAIFVGGPDVIVVPLASRHPDVTVIRVYPTYQPTYAAQANIDENPTADDFASPHDFNGG